MLALQWYVPLLGTFRRRMTQMELPWKEIPVMLETAALAQMMHPARLAVAFAVLTATSTREVFATTWDEIDQEERLWLVPSSRASDSTAHPVPLSDQSITILRAAEASSNGTFVFPGRDGCQPDAATRNALASLAHATLGTQDFRAVYEGWRSHNAATSSCAHSPDSSVIQAWADFVMPNDESLKAWTQPVHKSNGNPPTDKPPNAGVEDADD